MSLEQILAQMHEALGTELLNRIESGEATASELSVARQFLNDNHISGVAKVDNGLGQLASTLPDFKEPNEIQYQ